MYRDVLCFWYLAPNSSTWTLIQDWSATSTSTWNTTGLAAGTYTVRVVARTPDAVAGQVSRDVTYVLH